jgi:hypothetical protein
MVWSVLPPVKRRKTLFKKTGGRTLFGRGLITKNKGTSHYTKKQSALPIAARVVKT